MNLCQLYSNTLGQKITKPYLNPIFYPLPFTDYIVIQGVTKDSKTYNYWLEVIEFLKAELDNKQIRLVSVGGDVKENLPHCYPTAGTTSFPQLEYIIQNSIGYIGADSISAHIAGAYNKPRVILVSNNYKECVQPYFGTSELQTVIEPERQDGEKPSFSLSENPKSINRIKPEEIIDAVNRLFNLSPINNFNFPQVKSIHFGETYLQKVAEIIPNFLFNANVIPQNEIAHIRTDFLEQDLTEQNYQFMLQTVAQRKSIIYIDRPINIEVLKQVRPNIVLVVYKLPENDDINFVKQLKKSGLPFRLIKETGQNPAKSGQEEIAALKFKYLDVAPIQFIEKKKVEIEFVPNLFYRSNRVIYSNNNFYNCKYGLKNNLKCEGNSRKIENKEQLEGLLEEQEYLYIYGKTT